MKYSGKARLLTTQSLRPRDKAAAAQLLGRVSDMCLPTFCPATGEARARVYWKIQGQWWAVNVPATDLQML